MTSSGIPQRAHPPNLRPQSRHKQPENQWGADAAYADFWLGLVFTIGMGLPSVTAIPQAEGASAMVVAFL